MKPFILLLFVTSSWSQTIITKYEEETNFQDTHFLNSGEDAYENPDEYLDTPQIIRRHGYRSESHIVESLDGYLLTVNRIPANRNGKLGKQPVFLHHGLLTSSADWVITGNKSLAFLLSDLEYDVWLGDVRGNTYSKAHMSLLPDSDEFWNFSFHEMAANDLPAVLTYISNITQRHGEIIYIGHSMGTTVFFAFSSMFPKFAASTVKMMVALAPVAYLTHIQSPIRYLTPFADDYQWLAKHLGLRQFLPNDEIMKFFTSSCELFNIDKYICKQIIFAICGFDEEQLDKELLPLIVAHDPAGASTKTMVHYAQLIRHGNFVQFDYGEKRNVIKYGVPNPPCYNLSQIETPLYLIYGDNDWLCNETDVGRLASEVKNVAKLYRVPLKRFNHVDFLWGKDAPNMVYNKVIEAIKNK